MVCIAAVVGVFILYDAVNMQRARYMDRVVAVTSRIIEDVFPSTVRDRIVQEELQEANGAKSSTALAKNGLNQDKMPGVGIIADSYANVTVLFSDIVSFTTWSSTQASGDRFVCNFSARVSVYFFVVVISFLLLRTWLLAGVFLFHPPLFPLYVGADKSLRSVRMHVLGVRCGRCPERSF